jgi:hypothetical protein
LFAITIVFSSSLLLAQKSEPVPSDDFLALLAKVKLAESDARLKQVTPRTFRVRSSASISLTGRYRVIWPYIEAYGEVDARIFFNNPLNVSSRMLHPTDDESFQVCMA